ncbi:MAG: dehydrogenase E1 component subunit alpha/beta [Vicinamibacterales bacterium]
MSRRGSPRDRRAIVGGCEPFARDSRRRPLIAAAPADVYGFGSLVRSCERRLLDLHARDLVSGTLHTCIGQELCQLGVARALRQPGDAVFSNHRNHGHFLTFCGDFVGLVAEILGRSGGVRGGASGSQHISGDNFYSTGVQAGLVPVAAGRAWARKRQGDAGLTVAIIGDGTLGQGVLYETLNLAAIWSLPLLVVLEDNGIAQSTPTRGMIGGGSLASRGAAFGLPYREFDDAVPGFVAEVEAAIDALRASHGPGFFVIRTRRSGPHSTGPTSLQPSDGVDALGQLRERIAAAELDRIVESNEAYLDDVFEAALTSPPARYRKRPERAFRRAREPVPPHPAAAGATVRADINAALRHLIGRNPLVVLVGQDLSDPYGGTFKVTAGLSSDFPTQVVSTPISEAAVVGVGVGLALAGARPVVEIMFGDFLTLAVDQLLNQALKLDAAEPEGIPLVIRTATGGGRGYGPTHSQSLDGWLAALPGLTVVTPTHRHDAGALLLQAAERWLHPTLFFEPKRLYGTVVDRAEYRSLPADARDPGADLFPTLVRGEEGDVTLVTYGGMLPVVEAVADRLAEEELDVRIVAVSQLAPFPKYSLMRALATGRNHIIAVVEESWPTGSFGAELGAALLETGYQGRFVRVGPPPVPIPAARTLEADVLPSEEVIFDLVASHVLNIC